MIITVINQKGGVGKTTTVATLARLWQPRKPLVLDTDRQQAVSKFKLRGARVLPCAPDGVVAAITANARRRLVLIDCPPSPREAVQAVRAADLVLLPTKAVPLDLEATERLLMELGDSVTARVLLTMVSGATSRARAKEMRAAYGEVVLRTVISASAAVADAADLGLTILDAAPDSPVARQYIKLGMEILNYANSETA